MAEDKDKKEESKKDTAEDKKEPSKEESTDKKKDDEGSTAWGCGCIIAIIVIVIGAFFLFRSCSRQSSDDSSSQDKTEQSQSSSKSDNDNDSADDESSSSESEEEAQKKADKVSDLVVSDINDFKKKFADSNDDAYSWAAFVKGVSFNANGSADITLVPEFSELSNGQRFEVANHINNEVAAAADHYNALDDDEDAADGVFLTFYVDKTRIGRSKMLDKKTYKWFDN